MNELTFNLSLDGFHSVIFLTSISLHVHRLNFGKCPFASEMMFFIHLQLNRSTSGKNEEKKGNKGNGKGESASEGGKTAVVFSLKNEVGGLVKALRLFQVKSFCGPD